VAVAPLSREDLDFLLFDWLDVVALTSRPRFAEHSRETFDAVLDVSADLASRYFAPHNHLVDAEEPTIGSDGSVVMPAEVKEALEHFGAAGITAGPFDEEIGGLQLPMTIGRACLAWFQAANASIAAYPLLTIAAANLLCAHGSDEQIDTWVRPMLEGRYFGTMCLSEPEAGSSLADITTRAERAPDGTYRIVGTKMWISGGEHELSENIVHLVLAKIPGGGPSVKGISLFVVPKYLPDGMHNDVTLVGLNHKMGNRGTVNTLLAFGDAEADDSGAPAGATGYLVGEEHRGLAYMFHMMNEARIGVGMVAAAIGYRGYLQAVEYARERVQSRPIDNKDPASPPVPIIEHPDVRRMLLAQKAYVEGGLALGLYCSKLVDEQHTATDSAEAARLNLLLEVLTPIAKSWPSQWCLEANNLAIQVLGGYGYTRDFEAEQLFRDNRLNAIHEGTHGIQALDLLGRKVRLGEGAGLRVLADEIGSTIARALEAGGVAGEYATLLQAALDSLVATTHVLWSSPERSVTLANASIYLEAAGHVTVAWIWLEQLLCISERPGDFADGKRQGARYFFTYELPKVGPMLELLSSCDRTTLDMRPEWF
jgi:alkylation response protein AidB-like acyl-CoA dehydrogenase